MLFHQLQFLHVEHADNLFWNMRRNRKRKWKSILHHWTEKFLKQNLFGICCLFLSILHTFKS